jgi:hypothetical protein
MRIVHIGDYASPMPFFFYRWVRLLTVVFAYAFAFANGKKDL